MTFCFVLAVEAASGPLTYRQLLERMNGVLAGSPDAAMKEALRARDGRRGNPEAGAGTGTGASAGAGAGAGAGAVGESFGAKAGGRPLVRQDGVLQMLSHASYLGHRTRGMPTFTQRSLLGSSEQLDINTYFHL